MSKNEIIVVKNIADRFRKLQPVEKKLVLPFLKKIDINLIAPNDDLTGKKVRGFRLEEKKYEAESYIDVLRKILKIVFLKHPQENDKILSIFGRKNKYFSKNSNDLRLPGLIRGTNIYFETNENAKSICMRCEKILKLYDMDYTSFEIEYYI
jgi:hypothetical protein